MAEATPAPIVAPVETPTPAAEAVAPTVAPKPPESKPFADAARKERAIQAEKTAWKAQRAKEEAEWGERVKKAQAVEERIAQAKKTPLAALEALGLSYEELTIAQLNEGKPGADLAVRAAEEKIAALEKKYEDERKADREAAAKANKDAEAKTIASWHTATAQYVASQPEKYELINALGYQAEVGKMIEEHFDATGIEVSRDEAAAKLEAHLQTEQDPAVKNVFERLTKTKWFQSRYAPVAKEPAKATPPVPRRSSDTEVPAKKVDVPAPTITNRMTASQPQAKSAAAATREELREIARRKFLQGTGG